mmetsp:Transcript_32574/g.82059  ORF Transcript_32574/g.82059 Transcript_32574/m.82059 type:complete len:941 (-) Transcript_32574:76-2898(-)
MSSRLARHGGGALQRASAAARGAMFQRQALRALASVNHATEAATRAVDVVVIGGGIVGCAAARSLAKRGASVVLLEQNQLTAGTTWHAAGLMGTLKGSSLIMTLADYGKELYKQMNDEVTGKSLVGWANTGSLGIARCNDSMEQLVRQVQLARGIGFMQHRVVTPAEIKDIHPFLNLDGIVGGVYSPHDGIVNPADVALYMAAEARQHGAVLKERTECVDMKLDRDGRRIVEVRTDSGETISCGHAVICGGAWTKKLSTLAFGENRIPVAMMPHQYAIFDRYDGVGNHLPVTRDIHHKYYLKPEVGGFMVGVFEGEPLEHLPDVVRARNANTVPMPRDAEHEVYEESFEKAGRWLEAAMEHVPSLNEVGLKQWLHGPDTHSADHSPIIGRMPGTDNCFLATGFNSQGIQCGPGAGLALAESILDGAPHSLGCDFSGADPSRFFPGLCQDSDWVERRAAEGYGKTYSVHWPLEVFESARGRRLSPLHKQLVEHGAVFGETYGWERPLYFPRPEERKAPNGTTSTWADPSVDSPPHEALSFRRSEAEYFKAEGRECLATRNGAALFDLSFFGKLRISGLRSLEALQKCMTAEMDKAQGTVTYTLFCNERGGVLGDLTVARTGPDEFYAVTLTIQPAKVADQLRRVATGMGIPASDCVIEDVTEANAVMAVNGPKSREILAQLTDSALDNTAFPPGTVQRMTVAGVELMALRVSFAGELGWELHCPALEASRIHAALSEVGGVHGLQPAGYFALLNSLRVEKGFIHYGADVSEAETPLEAGLAFACKLKEDQPDFLGKAAILEQRKEGWRKRLVSLKLASNADVSLFGHEEELLYRNGELVGSVTSGGFSHTMDRAIGLGLVRGPPKVPLDWIRSGSYEVEVPVRRAGGAVEIQRFPVEVSTKCLVDAQGARVRGEHAVATPTAEARQQPMPCAEAPRAEARC